MQAPPGKLFHRFLDSIYDGKPLSLYEMGTTRDLALSAEWGDGWSTINISQWVKTHPTCTFASVDLSLNAIELAHATLEAQGLAAYCTFHCQDSLKFLANISWADFIFLDSCDGLQHGVDEFRLAVSTGARMIVADDYQTKAAWMVPEAKHIGWSYEQVDRYSVFRRPQ